MRILVQVRKHIQKTQPWQHALGIQVPGLGDRSRQIRPWRLVTRKLSLPGELQTREKLYNNAKWCCLRNNTLDVIITSKVLFLTSTWTHENTNMHHITHTQTSPYTHKYAHTHKKNLSILKPLNWRVICYTDTAI